MANDDASGAGKSRDPLTPEDKLKRFMTHPQVRMALYWADQKKEAPLGIFFTAGEHAYDGLRPRFEGMTPEFVTYPKEDGTLGVLRHEKGLTVPSAPWFSWSLLINVALFGATDLEALMGSFFKSGGSARVAPRFGTALDKSVPYVQASRAKLHSATPPLPYDGKGVTVCVIDMGCDFAHRNFRDVHLKTRLRLLTVIEGTKVISEWNSSDINDWLEREAPDTAVTDPKLYDDYDPHSIEFNVDIESFIDDQGALKRQVPYAHGTHVMDIAAGNGLGTGFPGVAPAADLAFVQPVVTVDGDGRRYIDGTTLFTCVAYAVDELQRAGARFVLNISLNTNEGPHDFDLHVDSSGKSLDFSRWLSDLFGPPGNTVPGQALVVSAGNFFDANMHTHGFIKEAPAVKNVDFAFPPLDSHWVRLFAWVEIPQGMPEPNITATLALWKLDENTGSPVGQVSTALNNQWVVIYDEQKRERGVLVGSMPYGEDGVDPLRSIKIGLLPPAENLPGPKQQLRREVWRLTLSSDQPNLIFHAWMERDDEAQSQIVSGKVDARSTLGATACAQNAVVVAAFDGRFGAPGGAGEPPGHITPFSSSGPIRNMPAGRDDLARPDLAAPGHSVWAAWSKRDPGFADPSANRAPVLGLSGTSMAAPHVTGAMALMIQKHFVESGGGPGPTQDQLRHALRDGAAPIDRSTASVRLWHPRFGFGRLDVIEALRRI